MNGQININKISKCVQNIPQVKEIEEGFISDQGFRFLVFKFKAAMKPNKFIF